MMWVVAILFVSWGIFGLFGSQAAAASGPSAMASPQQLDWLSRQIGVMITYNMQTYNPSMSTGHVVPASTFKPENVSISGEWLDAAAAFGAKYAVLTADHFSGFNLWPSQAWEDRGLNAYTVVSGLVAIGVLQLVDCCGLVDDESARGLSQQLELSCSAAFVVFSQAGSSWHVGTVKDVVADFSAQCNARGIAAGIFYSVHNNWAFNVSNFVSQNPAQQQAYNAFAIAQLTELLDGTRYESWYEMWFDAGVRNDINPAIGPLVRQLAPNAICHSCNGFAGSQGIRWVGNENAVTPLPNWYAVESQDACAGQPDAGTPTGSVFCPASCDTVIGLPSHHDWFWQAHTEEDNKSADELVQEYLTSVGRGCNLILNVAPAPTGGVDPVDQPLYEAMGRAIAALTATQLAYQSPARLVAGFAEGSVEVPVSGRLVVPTDATNITAVINVSTTGIMVSNVTIEVLEDLGGWGQRVAGHEVWLLAAEGGGVTPQWLMLANSSTIGFKRVYVPGAADARSEGSECGRCASDAAWPLRLFAVAVRVTAVPAGFAPPTELAAVAVYTPDERELGERFNG